MNFANETRKKNETSRNVLREDRVDPPIHTEYFHSDGTTTMNFIVNEANAVSSFNMRSPVPLKMAVPPDDTRHWRTKPVMRKVFAIEIEPRTVHWNNRLSFGAETINSAEVRRRCPRLNRTIFM